MTKNISSPRFTALDVFRGMTVCFMIIVNTPGDYKSTFAPLLHANWHGFTPTDLVFPSFLFAVGNAMSFVAPKWETMDQSAVLWKILKRTLLIFLLGYLMYWFPFVRLDEQGNVVPAPLSGTRIMGVLQRIALCYGIAALLVFYLKPKIAVYVAFCLILVYWGISYWLGNDGDPYSLTGNAGLKFDRWLMGESHLYHGEGIAFDPEGWAGTLAAVGNVIGGYIAGRFVRLKGNTYETLSKLLLAGFMLIVIAYFWDMFWPINKKLWSGPFVFHTVGLDCSNLAALIYLVSHGKNLRWTNFFEVFGKNPLFIYLLSEILVILLFAFSFGGKPLYGMIYQTVFSHAGPYWGSFLFAFSFMMLCWTVGYLLDRRKIYIRV